MNRYVSIFLLFLLIMILYSNNEGFINKPPPDKPDNLQFYTCHDYSNNNNLGNNNYKIMKHDIVDPQEGSYSYFLDRYKLRNYDEIFHSPICESKYNFKNINNLKMLDIIDYEDSIHEDKLLKIEEEYEKNSIKDPNFKYINPNNIKNKLLYNDKTIKLFLDNHHSQIDETLTHRLDQKFIPKTN